MNTGKAIFFGLALIALAIFARDIVKPADAGLMGSGRYMGAGDGVAIWIVDTETGASRNCEAHGSGVICGDPSAGFTSK